MNEEIKQNSKPLFNTHSRKGNVAKSSFVGLFNQLLSVLLGFAYRTVFIKFLAIEYLGLNGLFSNVLSILSLAELGIGSVIVFRLYKPIADNDVNAVAKIMRYYKIIYRIIAIVVSVIGIAIMPAIPYLISSDSVVPDDINLYLLYGLFLFETVSSYLFVYKTSIFTADQRNYFISLMGITCTFFKFGARILILVLTKNYTLVILAGTLITLFNNILFSIVATKRYRPIFKKADKLDATTLKEIKKDVIGTIFHKVGSTIVYGTDTIILSAFVGLASTGLYSNYYLIIGSVTAILTQVYTSFTSSVGNYRINQDKESFFTTYKNLNFACMFISSWCTVALFTLLTPFITEWIGSDMLLSIEITIVLSINFFFSQLRQINAVYISACGLFRYDKWRPIAESILNLVFSIILVKNIGMIGVFIGTTISSLTTVIWREPQLLYHKEFKGKKVVYYYLTAISFFCFTVGISCGLFFLFSIMPSNFWYLILKFVIAFIIPPCIISLFTFKSPRFKYFINLVSSAFNKIATLLGLKK